VRLAKTVEDDVCRIDARNLHCLGQERLDRSRSATLTKVGILCTSTRDEVLNIHGRRLRSTDHRPAVSGDGDAQTVMLIALQMVNHVPCRKVPHQQAIEKEMSCHLPTADPLHPPFFRFPCTNGAVSLRNKFSTVLRSE
jgi:hypothetical protein